MAAVIAFSLLVLFGGAFGSMEDYCNSDVYPSNTTWLQITKEVIGNDFVVMDAFRSIHCCAKGYKTIEWYKDSRAYPWAGGISSFILYPQAANQTIYTQQATESDSGNYTCRLKNDTNILEHTIHLTVVQKSPSEPRPTFTPVAQWVELGKPVRFYCEAFISTIKLPDVKADITWKRKYPDTTKPRNPSIPDNQISKRRREEDQIIGAYFIINEVHSEDYGEYVCSISNGDTSRDLTVWLHHKASEVIPLDNTIPWKLLIVASVVISLLILTLVTLYVRFWGTLIVRCKDAGIIGTKSADKTYDVMILHTEVEAPLVAAFIPILQEKYQYRCTSHKINESRENYNVAVQMSKMSHSIVLVLSPAHLSQNELKTLLARVLTLNPTSCPILVCLQEAPKVQPAAKDENGENLHILLKKTKVVVCQNYRDRGFWMILRQLLPSRKQCKPTVVLADRPEKTEPNPDLNSAALV